MKNWKTTILGTLAGFLLFLSSSGVKVGRIGNTDVLGVLAPAAIALTAALAKDHDVTGGERKQ